MSGEAAPFKLSRNAIIGILIVVFLIAGGIGFFLITSGGEGEGDEGAVGWRTEEEATEVIRSLDSRETEVRADLGCALAPVDVVALDDHGVAGRVEAIAGEEAHPSALLDEAGERAEAIARPALDVGQHEHVIGAELLVLELPFADDLDPDARRDVPGRSQGKALGGTLR